MYCLRSLSQLSNLLSLFNGTAMNVNVYDPLLFFRYLSIFLDECNRILSTKLKCANTMAEKNTTDLDESSRELEKLEETRKEVHKQM